MSDENSNFITPPPGLFPNAPVAQPVPTETQSATHQFLRPEATTTPSVQPPAFFPAPLGAQPRATSLTLETEDGARHVITSRAVFGRNPSATDEWAGALIVVIDDPAKSVSKSHAALLVTPTGCTLVDLGSTNGTEILRLDGTEVSLAPNLPVAVHVGEAIHIGSRTLRIIA